MSERAGARALLLVLVLVLPLPMIGLEGSVVPYGYVPEYYGHAQVLMAYDGAAWYAASFASLGKKDDFSYDWEVGYISY